MRGATGFPVAGLPVCGKDSLVDPAPAVGDDPRAAATLRRLVADHPASDEREADSKARFLQELARLTDPCDRSADPVHVTASAVVAGRRGTVLHLHRRMGRWMQPGGHVDSGESPEAAAARETLEETGLDAWHPPGGPALVHVDVHEAMDGHIHLDLRYLLLAGDAEPTPAPGESPEVRWFGWDEAEATADEALVGALRAGRATWAGGAADWGTDVGVKA